MAARWSRVLPQRTSGGLTVYIGIGAVVVIVIIVVLILLLRR